ncbi:MAG: NAD(P)H-dependent oxidoreductase [Spirochaetia bacterium]
MRWTVLNGSPRGKSSNTRVMLEQVRSGMESAAGGSVIEWDEYFLRDADSHSRAAETAASGDGLLIAYPLYTDSMPGITVRFLETLAGASGLKYSLEGRNIPAAFLAHSGFPDGIHTAHLPGIHREICGSLGFTYAGTLRKPGSEAVRLMPPNMQKSLFRTLREAGIGLVRDGRIPPDLEDALVRYETPGPMQCFAMRLMSATGIINMYWNRMLKKNGAWKKWFDAPYEGELRDESRPPEKEHA